MHFEAATAHHGEEDGEIVEVNEDFPDHRLQLRTKNTRSDLTDNSKNRRNTSSSLPASNLRVGVLERSVWGHVFDDVGQDGVDLAFLCN